MIVIVYHQKGVREAAPIMGKLCERHGFTFVDLKKKTDADFCSIQSILFAAMENFLMEEIPNMAEGVLVDGYDFDSICSKFDSFQNEFITKAMEPHGVLKIYVSEDDLCVDLDEHSIWFNYKTSFFVDLSEKVSKFCDETKSSSISSLLSSIGAYGFYMGPSWLYKLTEIKDVVSLPGNPGQKISFGEIANFALKNSQTPFKDGVLLVRQHHPIEIIARKFLEKSIAEKGK